MESVKNLWPKNVFEADSTGRNTMPRQILLQQAQIFTEGKKNVLEGDVRTSQGSLKNEHIFVHEFVIRAPVLGSFHFTLLRVAHGFGIYPLTVFNALREDTVEVKTESEFNEALEKIFRDEKTYNAIKVIEDSLGLYKDI